MANLSVLLYVMVSCVFVTFSSGVLVQMSYLIVSIPDLSLLSYLFCYVFIQGQYFYFKSMVHYPIIRLMIHMINFDSDCSSEGQCSMFVFDFSYPAGTRP